MSRESDDDTEILSSGDFALADEDTVVDTPTLDATEVADVGQPTEANVLGRGRRLETTERKAERRVPVGVMATVTLIACLTVAALYYLHRNPGEDATPPPGVARDLQSEAAALMASVLSGGDIETLPAQLIGLLGHDPASAAHAGLLREATRLADMDALLQQGHVLRVAAMRASGAFNTPGLERVAVAQVDPVLGTPERLEVLTAAAKAWRQGELIEALNATRPLARQGDTVADAQLQHYTRVVEAYDGIRKTGVENVPREVLLAFYLDLDPVADAFFWRNLEADLPVADAAGSEQAVSWIGEAGRLWVEYSGQGGIDGAVRQQPDPGSGFSERAQTLTGAADNLARVVESGLAAQPARDLADLRFPTLVSSELAYQVRCLEILLRYSDDALWQSRLAMLPRKDG
jgi:hypothetical protein